MAEYWINNLRENLEGTEIGDGSENDPFNMVSTVEDLIVPLSSHTIHLIGTNKPYKGNLEGDGLKDWIFENCTIIPHETEFLKVVYSVCRKIPVEVLDGTLPIKTKIFKKMNMKNRRFVLDGSDLIMVRPVYLKEKANKGFSWDKEQKKVTLDIEKLPKKEDVIDRKVTLEAISNDISK